MIITTVVAIAVSDTIVLVGFQQVQACGEGLSVGVSVSYALSEQIRGNGPQEEEAVKTLVLVSTETRIEGLPFANNETVDALCKEVSI